MRQEASVNANFSGIGRSEIEDRLRAAIFESERHAQSAKDLRTTLEAALREKRVMEQNLTAVQARCTELLRSDRLARFLESRPDMFAKIEALAHGIDRARRLHPEGCSYLAAASEFGEAARALATEDRGRYEAEVLDTAIVCMRILLGDVDERLEPAEPFAARKA